MQQEVLHGSQRKGAGTPGSDHNPDRPGAVCLPAGRTSNVLPPAADSELIAFVSARDGSCEIYVMEADGSGQVRLTHGAADNTNPAWLR